MPSSPTDQFILTFIDHLAYYRRMHVLAPFVKDLKSYTTADLRGDLQAGLTVSIFAVPQAMAYAMLAGIPPVYGLYAAIIMSIVAALWGHSPYVNTGPTNSAALLTASAILPFAHGEAAVGIVITLTLMVGVVRLLMGICRMGVLLDYVPESSFLGFTVGAGLLIALGQLHHMLGVSAPEAVWFPMKIWQTAWKVHELHPPALLISIVTMMFMLMFDRKARRFPLALVVIALAGAAAYWLHPTMPVRIVRDVAEIPRGLPAVVVPSLDLDTVFALAPAAVAIAIIGLIEAASIGQTLALRKGQQLDINQEFVGQGLSHIVGSFFQGLPGSGSFSRSLLIESTGGRTRYANVAFGVFTAIALLSVPKLLEWIPVSALAGLLVYIGVRLVDFARIRRVFATSRADAVIMLLTFLVTAFIRIEYGIFVGLAAAAVVHLHRTRELHMVEFVPQPDGRFREVPYEDGHDHPPSDIVVIGISGDLYYGISMLLRERLRSIIEQQQPKHLVLRVRRAYSIDYSCWSALFDVAEGFHRRGGRLYLCGIRPDYRRIIHQAGMSSILPDGQMFPATSSPFESFDLCLRTITGEMDAEARSRETCHDWSPRFPASGMGQEQSER